MTVTYNLKKVSHLIQQKIRNRVFRSANFCFFFYGFLFLISSSFKLFTFDFTIWSFWTYVMCFISLIHHYLSSLPLITTSHHNLSSLSLIATSHHYLSSLPLTTTSHHYLIQDNCIGHDQQHTPYGSLGVRWCGLRQDWSSHQSHLQSRTVQETSTFVILDLILCCM